MLRSEPFRLLLSNRNDQSDRPLGLGERTATPRRAVQDGHRAARFRRGTQQSWDGKPGARSASCTPPGAGAAGGWGEVQKGAAAPVWRTQTEGLHKCALASRGVSA